jgi:hypothetical protein
LCVESFFFRLRAIDKDQHSRGLLKRVMRLAWLR